MGALMSTPAGAWAQSVIDLPGVRASADAPGCTEPAAGTSVALSYACLNEKVAATATPQAPAPADADVRQRPSNTLGLYNAAGLGHRMGPNLGRSVQPYRPRLTYPSALGPSR